jgi:putative acetyltransferase
MRSEDARAFVEVHHAAVRGLAAKDYSRKVIENWAPLPITPKTIEHILANPDQEIRLLAESNGEIVGMGALVLQNSELRACYVLPAVARQGVGSALVREIERVALEQGLAILQLDASVTSEPFYRALGYDIRERGEHLLSSGERMACAKMEKRLRP